MTEGTCVGPQGTVPLQGECEIKQVTAATDVITITEAASGSGDFIVCQTNEGTEKFYVTSAGAGYFAAGVTLNAAATEATVAALASVSGSFGFDSSASWALMIVLVNKMQARLKTLGLLT